MTYAQGLPFEKPSFPADRETYKMDKQPIPYSSRLDEARDALLASRQRIVPEVLVPQPPEVLPAERVVSPLAEHYIQIIDFALENAKKRMDESGGMDVRTVMIGGLSLNDFLKTIDDDPLLQANGEDMLIRAFTDEYITFLERRHSKILAAHQTDLAN